MQDLALHIKIHGQFQRFIKCFKFHGQFQRFFANGVGSLACAPPPPDPRLYKVYEHLYCLLRVAIVNFKTF
jgi:hypothetical protein